jgi:hypothetical protein
MLLVRAVSISELSQVHRGMSQTTDWSPLKKPYPTWPCPAESLLCLFEYLHIRITSNASDHEPDRAPSASPAPSLALPVLAHQVGGTNHTVGRNQPLLHQPKDHITDLGITWLLPSDTPPRTRTRTRGPGPTPPSSTPSVLAVVFHHRPSKPVCHRSARSSSSL